MSIRTRNNLLRQNVVRHARSCNRKQQIIFGASVRGSKNVLEWNVLLDNHIILTNDPEILNNLLFHHLWNQPLRGS